MTELQIREGNILVQEISAQRMNVRDVQSKIEKTIKYIKADCLQFVVLNGQQGRLELIVTPEMFNLHLERLQREEKMYIEKVKNLEKKLNDL